MKLFEQVQAIIWAFPSEDDRSDAVLRLASLIEEMEDAYQKLVSDRERNKQALALLANMVENHFKYDHVDFSFWDAARELCSASTRT